MKTKISPLLVFAALAASNALSTGRQMWRSVCPEARFTLNAVEDPVGKLAVGQVNKEPRL